MMYKMALSQITFWNLPMPQLNQSTASKLNVEKDPETCSILSDFGRCRMRRRRRQATLAWEIAQSASSVDGGGDNLKRGHGGGVRCLSAGCIHESATSFSNGWMK